jgi:uncharacterized protein YhaN
MIFRRFHVDGFGIWRDLTLDGLDPGLNVLLAPNEGGKTTLMSFTRAVLYGFRQRNHPERYEPLRGGKHGGYLEISERGDTYRILRTHDQSSSGALQITDGNGHALPENTLERLLRGTTRELYENVFAFGLGELQRIETMRNEEVVAHIYSAGMAAAGTNPLGFRERLEAQRRERFLPRGKKQDVARALDRIQALQRDIEPLQERPEEHARLIEEAASLRARLETLDAQLAERQRDLDAARRARSAWGDYEELLAAESALEALGVPLEEASDAEASDLLTDAEAAVLAERSRIRSLHASVPRLRELRAATDKHATDADTAQSALNAHLMDLGEKWDVNRILATDAGLKQRETAREYAGELHELESEIEQIAARAADANEAYEVIVSRAEPVSREAVMLTWAVAIALTFFSVFMPLPSRIIITAAVGAVGLIAGTVAIWLRYRGNRQLDADRIAAADRETTLWAQHELAEGNLEEKRKEWRGWLQKRGLDPDLSPNGALDLLDRIREAQEVARQQHAARYNHDKAHEELIVACGRVNALLGDLGHDTVRLGGQILEAVEPLVGELETLHNELDNVEDQHVRLRTQMQQYVQARAALRAGAGEEGLDGLRARLEALDPDKIQRLLDDAETALGALQAQRDGVNEQLGGIAERIAHLEGDGELSELLLEREQARSKLVTAVNAWAEYTVAAALFDQARKVYEEQRQPQVLRLASRYFHGMTGGAYERVLAPLGEIDLQVEETGRGQRKGPEALSRGTKEQLYLAMRLALAAVYAEQLVALPLVADDILVNFDDRRRAAAASLLGEYAAEGIQVIAFTCHRRLAEVFAAEAPGARIIELPRPA